MRRDVFQAIADPTRREIIAVIAHQSLTPNAVAEKFEMSRQAVSKHIKILTESGLLSLEIQGREYYYTVQPKKIAEVHDWLESIREIWDKKFSQLDELLEQMQAKPKRKKSPGRS